MKLISVIHYPTLSILLLLSVNLYAEASENTKNRIDNACLRQAVSLVNQLKSELYTDMDSTQSNKIVKLATNTCRTQFNQTNNPDPHFKKLYNQFMYFEMQKYWDDH